MLDILTINSISALEPNMKSHLHRALLGLGLTSLTLAAVVPHDVEVLRFSNPIDITPDSLHNIHVDVVDKAFEGHLRLVYGDCDIEQAGQGHHDVGNVFIKRDAHLERLVWITPSDTPHLQCLHAFSESFLVGRSLPISVSLPINKRESLADLANMEGPWFDGVAYMKSKQQDAAVVSKAKNTSVAIIGGGMSGLMTSHLLESVGIHDWHIIESSERIGGRIRTKYLNNSSPEDYTYQEMGPMRFPVSITYADTNETLQIMDHRMVFQLAGVLNKMNAKANKTDLQVNFIPWIQSSPNVPADSGGVRLPDGRIPSAADVAANSSLVYTAASSNATAAKNAEAAVDNYTGMNNRSTIRNFASNMYKMHKHAVDNGLFHWSEAGYLRYALGYDANISDYVAGTTDTPMWLYEDVYFAATEWRTIDKGLESLPRAFYPLVSDRLTLNRTIDGLVYNETSGKIAVAWREDPLSMTPITKEYDYAVVAAPFSKVRLWSLPQYSSLLSRAISTLNYGQSCKMALMYETRFWEHLPEPIYGGCGTVDVAGVGNVCYPSYKMNNTGPGVILASYISGIEARSTAALSDEEHVALIQRTMIEVHGEIAAEQFTGIYDRQCWEVDRHQAGAWASPLVGQQDLYLPAYYQTEYKSIFIGEHTSYTHAWIFSALDSAVRGTVQLLLDLGLVDEAKGIVEEWMGRWIKL